MRRVAVTGMGVISPVGNDVDTFWDSLISGKCGIDYIKRFDTENFKVKIAAEVKDFEPELYLGKNEIRRTDLFAQYAVAAAAQAIEQCGPLNIDPYRIGVYVGSGVGGMNTFEREHSKLISGGSRQVSPFFIPMMISNMAAGSIAIKYGAKGPCLPIVTACATSSHSVGEAFRLIKNGYADAVIAGGAEAAITPLSLAGFTNCMALTTKNDPISSSIPFDKRRDGFVIGEGAGMLVLEDYEHALKRGAKILAEVCGYGNTCDAFHSTAPHPEGEGGAAAIKLALEEGGVYQYENLYINAHGTSTPLNDKIETIAIKNAFGQQAYKIPISSTKSMTGHMLGAAGAVEAIASIMTLKTGIIPPTIGLTEPDPECDLDYVPLKSRKSDIKAALSNSFGFGGHNACLVMKKV